MNAVKKVVIIPTYNELDNIQKLLPQVFAENIEDLHVLVVDDNSPDGTGEKIRELGATDPRVHLLHREKKMGLGTAYCAGFKWALQNGYDLIFEMDADLSHDPRELKNFVEAAKTADLVIGSRYLTGINVINWPMRRLILSYGANIYTRFITGMPIHDATGGFKCFRRQVLEAINLDEVRSNGYAFQIEMNFKAFRKKFVIKEIPIIFVDRQMGKSKMSKKIVREAVLQVIKLRLRSIFGLL